MLKVDLIHVFCGQIDETYGVGGFHARPGNNDPQSATTVGSRQKGKPRNEYIRLRDLLQAKKLSTIVLSTSMSQRRQAAACGQRQ